VSTSTAKIHRERGTIQTLTSHGLLSSNKHNTCTVRV